MRKKLLIIFTVSFLSHQSYATPLPVGRLIATGDSLFGQKAYTEAFDIYQKIVHEGQGYSPRMLLKMAFVKDGLGQYPEALYYLSLLYQFEKDPAILNHISSIAKEHELNGYEQNDEQFFTDILDTSKFTIAGVALGLISIVVMMSIVFNWGKRRNPGILFASALLIAAFLGVFNLGYQSPRAVIKERSLLMSEPSAGAPQLQQVDKGHRVKVLGQEDIWYEIEWKDRKAYIRADNLLVL